MNTKRTTLASAKIKKYEEKSIRENEKWRPAKEDAHTIANESEWLQRDAMGSATRFKVKIKAKTKGASKVEKAKERKK